MSKTEITAAEMGQPIAIIANSFIRLRSTQRADLTVHHARTRNVRVTLAWGGVVVPPKSWRVSYAAFGVVLDSLIS